MVRVLLYSISNNSRGKLSPLTQSPTGGLVHRPGPKLGGPSTWVSGDVTRYFDSKERSLLPDSSPSPTWPYVYYCRSDHETHLPCFYWWLSPLSSMLSCTRNFLLRRPDGVFQGTGPVTHYNQGQTGNESQSRDRNGERTTRTRSVKGRDLELTK